ncbi:MAG: cystathionine beta-lyase [Betaproteobacteria bacterium]|nr:cystathionine beta-lyase [Betaproteobacteria bacterium]
MAQHLPDTTPLIHHPYTPPAEFEAPQPGVFKASTVFFPHVAAMRSRQWKDKSGYTYGLHGTPTSYTLEERLCTLEGAGQCLLVPSGLAAIATTAMALLRSGDEVLIPDNAYGPTKALAEGELAQWGITHRYYDPLQSADLSGLIGERTRLVWLEAPGSVSLEFPDLPALVRICRDRGVRCALDNTWGSGLAFAPFDLLGDASLGVDISVHALTKYPSGGGDVLMGSITTRDTDLHHQLKLCHMRLGLGVAANDVETVLRSLPSIGLRYAVQDQSARALARWWQTQPQCVQVLHPALDGSPGHAHWQALCAPQGGEGLAAALFSVILSPRYSQAQVDAFCDALQCFRIGFSWAGPVSLVMPYALAEMRTRAQPQLQSGHLVRFAMGLESVAALQADLSQALQQHLPV